MAGIDFSDVEVPCPMVLMQKEGPQGPETFSIFCQRLQVKVDVYLSTAMIKMRGQWHNENDVPVDCVFALPTKGTVTNVQASVSSKETVLLSGVINNQDLVEQLSQQPTVDLRSQLRMEAEEEAKATGARYKTQKEQNVDAVPEMQSPYERYMPDLFRVPIDGVPAGDTVTIVVEYMETLSYKKGKGFYLKLPLTFHEGFILPDTLWTDVVSVMCKLNSIARIVGFDSKSHKLRKTMAEDESVLLEAINIKSMSLKGLAMGSTTTGTTRTDAGDGDARTGAKAKLVTDDAAGALLTTHTLEGTDGAVEADIAKCGRDFELTFKVKGSSREIGIHAIKKIDDEDSDRTHVALFVTPPRQPSTTFPRCFYFVLDRSGSMKGQPYAEATRALHLILKEHIREQDTFNVICFDHRSLSWRALPALGNVSNKQHCLRWLQDMVPEKGGTNMKEPLQQALEDLGKKSQTLLPYIVLLTDGAVQNEREICKMVQTQMESGKTKARIFTLGIGTFCNWFYLKMLAHLGRGLGDVIQEHNDLATKIKDFAKKCKTPVMTDISLEVRGPLVGDCRLPVEPRCVEYYPTSVPDLYATAAVSVAIEVSADIKQIDQVVIRGFDPEQETKELVCDVQMREDLPVDKMFVKHKLDHLTAMCWMEKDSKDLYKKAAALSVAHSMPAASVTTLVSFEMEREQARNEGLLADDLDDEKDDDLSSALLPGGDSAAAADAAKKKKKPFMYYAKAKQQMKKNPKMVAAAAAAGTVVIVATSAATFGDIGKTLGNIPFFGGDMDFGAIDDCECCGGDDDCDCDDCDCEGDDCVIL